VRLLTLSLLLLWPVLSWAGKACVSAASGNWDSPSSWKNCGGTHPGDGDIVTLTNKSTITIPAGVTVTVGDSPSDDNGVPAVQCLSPTGSGVLIVNGTLIWRGPVRQCASWVFGPGSTVTHDSSRAAKSASYSWQTTNGNASILQINGTATSRVTMNKATGSANSGGFGNGRSDGGQVRGTYFDVFDWGQFYPSLHSAGATFDISHCTLTRTGPLNVYELNPAATWSIDTCAIADPPNPSSYTIDFCQWGNCGALSSGKRNFSNNWMNSGQIKLSGGVGVDIGLTFRNNVLKTPSAAYAPLAPSANAPVFTGDHWKNNLIWFDRPSGFNNQYASIPSGTLSSTFVISTNRNCAADQKALGGQVDNNLISATVPVSTVIDGWVWDTSCAYGAALINSVAHGTAPWTWEVRNNIVIPDASGRGITLSTYAMSAPCTQKGSNFCATSSIHHNTFVGNHEPNGTAGLASTENAAFPGAYSAVRDNLVWQPALGYGTLISGPGSVSPGTYANVDYNWTWNIANGNARYKWFGSGAYTATPGLHDKNGDPRFADPTRRFSKWCKAKGAVDLDSCFSKFKVESPTYDPSFNVQSLLEFVRAGFKPSAQGISMAGSTGSSVGAVSP
jgi:hypothetical protein